MSSRLMLVMAALGMLWILGGCSDNRPVTESQPVTTERSAESVPAAKVRAAEKTAPQTEAQPQEQPAQAPTEPEQPTAEVQTAPKSTNPTVVLETSRGNITIELWPDKAPQTVENFLTYVRDGFYDGTIFHRVISGFMIQGGGFTEEMQQKPTRSPIKNEAATNLPNERGTIAMARLPMPDSATSQFFINHKDNAMLNYRGPANPGYAVFGKVIEGMNVVDSIAGVQTTSRAGHQDVPVTPVVIKDARVVEPQ